MATKTKDSRQVTVNVTQQEMATFLGNQARQAGLIDFDADLVDVLNQGEDEQGIQRFDVIFYKENAL